MTEKRFCGNCGNAKFVLTPTGRIKKNEPGNCMVALEEKANTHRLIYSIPALSCGYIGISAVWPDSDASNCRRWEAKC